MLLSWTEAEAGHAEEHVDRTTFFGRGRQGPARSVHAGASVKAHAGGRAGHAFHEEANAPFYREILRKKPGGRLQEELCSLLWESTGGKLRKNIPEVDVNWGGDGVRG